MSKQSTPADEGILGKIANDWRKAVLLRDDQVVELLTDIIQHSDWDQLLGILKHVTDYEADYDVDQDGAWVFLKNDGTDQFDPNKVREVLYDRVMCKYIVRGTCEPT
jgi:Cft2 family RNA processing exonuclease